MVRRKFTKEFKFEAVKLVTERGVAVAQAARDLDHFALVGCSQLGKDRSTAAALQTDRQRVFHGGAATS